MTTPETRTRQASAVAIGRQAVLIEGSPGSGKSTLALALIDRGAQLIGDDGVSLELIGRAVMVSPHPNIRGKLEIRGVGIVDLPVTSAPAALVIDLDEEGERHPTDVAHRTILGCDIPCLALGKSDAASLPLRVEWALRIHGIRKEPE